MWPMAKQAHRRVLRRLYPKHLDRHVQEFPVHHKMCERDTVNQLDSMYDGKEGERLTYMSPTDPTEVPLGARI